MNQRIKSLAKKLGFNILSSSPITKEASYREYFRIKTSKGSFILCYLDPNLGSQKNFLRIYKYLDPSIRPNILASNLEQGITIQEDLGNFDLYDVWEYEILDYLGHGYYFDDVRSKYYISYDTQYDPQDNEWITSNPFIILWVVLCVVGNIVF